MQKNNICLYLLTYHYLCSKSHYPFLPFDGMAVHPVSQDHSGLYYKNNIIIINRTSLIVKRVISDQCMSTLTDGNAGFVGLPLCEFVHRRVR